MCVLPSKCIPQNRFTDTADSGAASALWRFAKVDSLSRSLVAHRRADE